MHGAMIQRKHKISLAFQKMEAQDLSLVKVYLKSKLILWKPDINSTSLGQSQCLYSN